MANYGYRCFLDVQPDSLVPHALRGEEPEIVGDRLTINAGLMFTETGRCPYGGIPFVQAVEAQHPTAWVRDPVTEVVTPFTLGPALVATIAKLRPGRELSEPVLATTLSLLNKGGLIYDSVIHQEKKSLWNAALKRASAELRYGYTSLGQLLNPFTLGAMRVYFREFLRVARPQRGDEQCSRRRVAYNEPVACFLHHQLTPIVANIVGVAIEPSYVYFSSYEDGAQLPWHKDQGQCEFSLTMLIDYAPEPETESPWPLLLETPRGIVSIHQRIGETLLYRGREMPHARDELPADSASTHLFFHYVHA